MDDLTIKLENDQELVLIPVRGLADGLWNNTLSITTSGRHAGYTTVLPQEKIKQLRDFLLELLPRENEKPSNVREAENDPAFYLHVLDPETGRRADNHRVGRPLAAVLVDDGCSVHLVDTDSRKPVLRIPGEANAEALIKSLQNVYPRLKPKPTGKIIERVIEVEKKQEDAWFFAEVSSDGILRGQVMPNREDAVQTLLTVKKLGLIHRFFKNGRPVNIKEVKKGFGLDPEKTYSLSHRTGTPGWMARGGVLMEGVLQSLPDVSDEKYVLLCLTDAVIVPIKQKIEYDFED